jgi:hypothetical protein
MLTSCTLDFLDSTPRTLLRPASAQERAKRRKEPSRPGNRTPPHALIELRVNRATNIHVRLTRPEEALLSFARLTTDLI